MVTQVGCSAGLTVVWKGAAAIAGLCTCFVAAAPAAAATFSFSRIADTSTLVPGTEQRFEQFRSFALDGDTLAFSGSWLAPDGQQQHGIFTSSGSGLTRVIDTSTLVPDSPFTFTSFADLDFDDGTIAFLSSEADPDDLDGSSGVYTVRDGVVSTIASRRKFLPELGIVNFITDLAIDNGLVALAGGRSFQGDPAPPQELYFANADGSDLRAIATSEDPRFNNLLNDPFSSLSLDNGTVAFLGAGLLNEGIYTHDGESLTQITDLSDFFDHPDDFPARFFRNVDLSNGVVAFGAGDEIFLGSNGGLVPVFGPEPPFPGRDQPSFLGFSYEDGDFVLDAGFSDPPRDSIYTTIGGGLTEVLSSLSFLDGKQIADDRFLGSLHTLREGHSGNSFAFSVRFTDGSTALYRADLTEEPEPIPEPSTLLGLLAGGAIAIRFLGQRRSSC